MVAEGAVWAKLETCLNAATVDELGSSSSSIFDEMLAAIGMVLPSHSTELVVNSADGAEKAGASARFGGLESTARCGWDLKQQVQMAKAAA